ncbi:MAG: translation elongation factor EF-1 subunit alpha [Candidatus Woesearchaeota archaeon]
MARKKPHMNLIFIGHVDHGKSTTIGRVMYDTGSIDDQAMRKLKEKAKEVGKSGFEFAFAMDNLEVERERGVTIALSHKKFDTDKYSFTIIDAPGHSDFVKNMITGANQADAAVLVVAADDGVNAQTKEHAFLAKAFGIGQIIVAVNKIDKVDYDEGTYHKVEKEVQKLLKRAGFKKDKIDVVPISALSGDNVVNKSENMDWYKGRTLLSKFDDLNEPEKPKDLPLRMPIQDAYKIQGVGTVSVGRIETGDLKPGEKVTILPGRTGEGVSGEVKSIEMHHEQLESAGPGDNVGVNIRGVSKKDITRGDVICSSKDPAPIVEEFDAQIVVIDHPTVIPEGYTPVFHAHTAQVACQIKEIVSKIDPKTGQPKEGKPDYLKKGDIAIVKVKPTKPFVLETSEDNPYLSRFAIRDMGKTVAAGVVLKSKKKN